MLGVSSTPPTPPPDSTTPSQEQSRTGLVVTIVLVVIALGAAAWFLLRDDADDTATPAATATATVTVTPTQTPTDEPTPTPTPSEPVEPSPTPDEVALRPDGVGPLDLRMSKDEALATGVVTEGEFEGQVELVADSDVLPGVFICWDADVDEITSFTVKDGSPIETPEGIGVTSTADDLRAAYPDDLVEQEDGGEQWFTVPVDDEGYAFFPTDVELIMLSGTDDVLAVVVPGTEPC